MAFDTASLKFNSNGLIPAIAQDANSGEVLMMAWMNADSISKTLESGQVTYWSRSRQEYWVKGATSGNTQTLVDLRIDCDRDCLLIEVKQEGPACHTGRRTCFFTAVRNGNEVEIVTVAEDSEAP
ncbi:phosphoribosyl-AMP cyclohydrolase [Cognatiyoonia koreensis]|uniref:Phosphoribosyl-AMP cyclohydrolase n=1 Tax=Cognatiyoonia koreensis TaxID=364200 RepID=A0A1I0P8D7_9RHOB|nr:phosphoribosyl-AMP cyclohydrolase [Cognatiyoonia koreensis]SEW10663.1 phosphoribosyl-AMP cyclohydrolase [Cognatiyoonia koreensis]